MTSVASIFDSMAYGPAPEGDAEALAWIAGHQGRFGHWINGAFTAPGAVFETRNPATGTVLAEVTQGSGDEIALAVAAAQAAPQFSQAECQKLNAQRLEVRKQLRQPYSPEHGQQLQEKLTELEGVLERHCKKPVKNPPKLP